MFRAFLVLSLVVSSFVSQPVLAKESWFRSDRPDRYIVKDGDTLWRIAGMFLKAPWFWEEIWMKNPQIKNPHLIYPGDIVYLVYVDGKPRIKIQRRDEATYRPNQGLAVTRVTPNIRVKALNKPIPVVPTSSISQFVRHTVIGSTKDLEQSPYIVSIGRRLRVATGDTIYVRNLADDGQRAFSIFKPKGKYIDPDTKQVLAHRTQFIGEAVLEKNGDPATLEVTYSKFAIKPGDRLAPLDDTPLEQNFLPHPPKQEIYGRIISPLDEGIRMGQHQSVVINRGSAQGVDAGTVFKVYQAGEEIVDRFAKTAEPQTVSLPDVKVGHIMVYKTFETISYALIMETERPLRVLDKVMHPDG